MNNTLIANPGRASGYRPPIHALDLAPSASEVRVEVMTALSGPQKMLPCKLFYDEYGSRLFDEICNLPEYYTTRTEQGIIREYAAEMASAIGPRPLIVEY